MPLPGACLHRNRRHVAATSGSRTSCTPATQQPTRGTLQLAGSLAGSGTRLRPRSRVSKPSSGSGRAGARRAACRRLASGEGARRLASSGLKSRIGAGMAAAPSSTRPPLPSPWQAMRAAIRLASPAGCEGVEAATSSELTRCCCCCCCVSTGPRAWSCTGTATEPCSGAPAISSTARPLWPVLLPGSKRACSMLESAAPFCSCCSSGQADGASCTRSRVFCTGGKRRQRRRRRRVGAGGAQNSRCIHPGQGAAPSSPAGPLPPPRRWQCGPTGVRERRGSQQAQAARRRRQRHR